MKKIPAFFAALLITGLVGLVMLGIGGAAFMNTHKLPVTNSATTIAAVQDVSAQTQINASQAANQAVVAQAQSQAQLNAYKAQLDLAIQRINDANTQIQSLQTQLDQTNQQITVASTSIQQYQAVLTQLQQRGLIVIGSDGTITIRGRFNN